MSPRRKVSADDSAAEVAFADRVPRPRRRWGVTLAAVAAALVIAASATVGTLVLITREKDRRAALEDAAVVDYVASFMTQYTSPDPFHANDYADRVLAQATGQLAQLYRDKMNEIVVQVAQAEPTQGNVLAVGIERWNDDGSASVVVATETTTTTPDGKKFDRGNRWLATAMKEGDQWKISNLLQVI